ncbi:MAG: hypothetical protein K2H09_10255 [Treponemataceae bacterium]|nr:hypothetical protein [Treponemataceae bacterium]
MTKDGAADGRLAMTYDFSSEEIIALALHFRSRQGRIPSELADFAAAIEKAVYDSLSIGEAQRLYS